MTTLDIVDLIENNPIVRLSDTYQHKLLTKIKSNFSNENQQLFVTSFYCYLNYNSNADFIIDLDNVWKWLEFSHKHKAKILLEKSFIENMDYKKLLETSVKQDSEEKKHGGHNKEKFMLTINTFKRFCLKAGTAKADQIHDYYIKMEETLHSVINEETNELKLQVQQLNKTLTQNEQNTKKIIDNLIKEKELEKHKIILREFGNVGAIVYVMRVKSYENGEYIVKIGESRRGVEARYNEHKSHYDESVLLDCFLVKKSKDFETFIHTHPDIKLNQVTTLSGHETAKELFLIGKNLSYNILLKTIKQNIQRFNETDYDALADDIHTIKNILSNGYQSTNTCHSDFLSNDVTLKTFMDSQNLILQRLNNLEKSNKELLDKLNSTQTKTTTGFEQPLVTVGPRLQKINPDTLQLIKVYETVTECMKEDSRIKRPSINKAIEENTVYNGYRWAFVDRELDPSVLRNIQPTKVTKIQNLGYIAKINSEKTQIINVYLDRKTAAIANGYSSSGLDTPVKNVSITNGHYYMLYDKCEDELRGEFEARINGEPTLYKDGVGQFDTQNNLVREFVCKYDCIRSLTMSDKTLAKALDKNIAYNGHYYKSLGSKTQCFA
jgi:phage anti-repressor protein